MFKWIKNIFKKKEKETPKKIRDISINAAGIMCDHCKDTLRKALKQVDGVVSVDYVDAADYNTENGKRIVKVGICEGVDEAALRDVIKNESFKL